MRGFGLGWFPLEGAGAAPGAACCGRVGKSAAGGQACAWRLEASRQRRQFRRGRPDAGAFAFPGGPGGAPGMALGLAGCLREARLCCRRSSVEGLGGARADVPRV
jgi:hypothetical protein